MALWIVPMVEMKRNCPLHNERNNNDDDDDRRPRLPRESPPTHPPTTTKMHHQEKKPYTCVCVCVCKKKESIESLNQHGHNETVAKPMPERTK